MGFLKNRKINILVLVLITVITTACSSADAISSFEDASLYEPSNGVGRAAISAEIKNDKEPENEPAEPNGITICVDPGHGFDDGGAESDFIGELTEKDINLSVAGYLKEELETLGYSVLTTHDGENFPITSAYDNNDKFNPYERVAYANSVTSNYFVSLHCNSNANETAEGTRIYYYDNAAKITHDSEDIAESIRANIESMFPDAVKPTSEMTADHCVTRNTKVAASLIEMGFITNESDASHMVTEEWQKEFAKAVAAGIDSYYNGKK